jgi:hypothetical protein
MPENDLGVGESVLTTVQDNQQLLIKLMDQVVDLSRRLSLGDDPPPAADQKIARQLEEAVGEQDHLSQQVAQLESQVEDLRQQNRELASKVAGKNVRETICTGEAAEALTWDQRKQLILQQLEEESFDAESFVANMSYEGQDGQETPEQYLERLVTELHARNQEVQELRHLLDHQSQARDGQYAIGAAAIAEIIDSDELVQQERQRLQQLQVEWEEKFRDGEIEASLERAKLSRERQELLKRQSELTEELEHMRRELRQQDPTQPATSRRWLAKLGISDQS